jgi:hypothetical protein
MTDDIWALHLGEQACGMISEGGASGINKGALLAVFRKIDLYIPHKRYIA